MFNNQQPMLIEGGFFASPWGGLEGLKSISNNQ